MLVTGDHNPPDKTALLQNALITIPLTIITLVTGYIGAVKNSIWLVVVFMVGTIAAVTYAIIKLVDIYTTSDQNKYEGVRKSLTIFSGLLFRDSAKMA